MRRALFLLIFAVIVFFLTVDSIIGFVSDFLVELITSNLGISLFVFISAVFTSASFVIFQLLNNTTAEVRRNSKELRVLHRHCINYSTISDSSINGFASSDYIFYRILYCIYYNHRTLSPLTAAFVMIMACLTLITWFRFNRGSYVVLIFALAFSINAYVFIYTSFASIYHLLEKNMIITPQSEVIYPTDVFQPGSIQSILSDVYKFAATANFVMLLAGSAILLRHYSARLGQIKFWAMVIVPSIYYISILVDALGIYVPASDAELFNYYIYASLNGIIGGILLGLLFWSISRTMRPNKAVMNYLLLCSYGLVLLSIATVGQVSVAAFPPFGIAAFLMLPLSSYMIILGFYSASTSISQDVRLRQYIRELCKADSGFLSTIGEAQLEKKVQAKASDLEGVVKEERLELEKNSGVKSSMQEQDIKQYLLEVLQEVDKHKSSG